MEDLAIENCRLPEAVAKIRAPLRKAVVSATQEAPKPNCSCSPQLTMTNRLKHLVEPVETLRWARCPHSQGSTFSRADFVQDQHFLIYSLCWAW